MRLITDGEDAVWRLWNPRSVAVIGASNKAETLPWWPLHLLKEYGFGGELYPVNPTRDSVLGVPCVPSILSLERPVDVAVVVLSAERTPDAVRECAEAGVRVALLVAQGFGELGEHGRAEEQLLIEIAQSTGMRIAGPNTDGVANLASRAVLTIQPLFGQGIECGPVAVVAQSGASASSLIVRLKREGIGCRLYASAGNEIDLGLADYLSVAVQDVSVKVLLCFVEAIRRPSDFIQVAELAAELGKPIVLIKVGRTEQAARRAAAHTGALAGADRVYDALFRSLGIIRVDELSEIVAVAKLLLSTGAPRSARVGIMSVSGGMAGALADRAASMGLQVPTVSQVTESRLHQLLPYGAPLNPCDLTGDIVKRPELAAEVYRAFDADDAIDLVVYARKEITGQTGRQSAALLASASAAGSARLAVYAMDGEVNDDEQDTYRTHGIPIFNSAADLFTAVGALAKFTSRPRRAGGDIDVKVRALQAGPSGMLTGVSARRLFVKYGIAFPTEGTATSADAAVQLAEEIGYPVVLKVLSDRIAHKTEIAGVMLGLTNPNDVRTAFDLLVRRGREALGGQAPDGVLVQQQILDGVEVIAGLMVDEEFGPFVLVGTGGVMAEVIDDTVLRRAPVTLEEASSMICELRGRPLLDGFRGRPPADVGALAELVTALSRLGADYEGSVAEVDLNPVLVRPRGKGAVAVDALVALKESSSA